MEIEKLKMQEYKADFISRLSVVSLPIMVLIITSHLFYNSIKKVDTFAATIIVIFIVGFLYVCWYGGSRLVLKGGRLMLFSRPNHNQFKQRLNRIKLAFQKNKFIRLVFVSGEAPSKIYSHEALEEMRRIGDAIKMQKIGVIAGPVILLDDKKPTCMPPIFTMVREGFVDLYISKRRQTRHFMVSSDGFLRWEKLHKSCAGFRFAIIHDWKIDNKSSEAINLFDSIIRDQRLEKYSDINGEVRFICMKRGVLKKMVRDIEPFLSRFWGSKRRKFNDLTVQEIIDYANRGGYEYFLPQSLENGEW